MLGRGSQILAIAAVTIATGGDNLGAYIPVFASDRRVVIIYGIVFVVMAALWCVISYKLVKNRPFARS